MKNRIMERGGKGKKRQNSHLSKVPVDNGGNDTPEIAGLAAKTAKIALTEVSLKFP